MKPINMETILAFFIALVLGLGGGAAGGVHFAKQKQNAELNAKIDLQHTQLIDANAKLDSLQALPAKVDTVYKVVTKIEERTDTLILVSKEILDNTKEIKADVKDMKKVICN